MAHPSSLATELAGRLRAVAEAAADGIVVIDEQSTILFVNPAVEAIFGRARGELVGRELTVLIPERFRDAHRRGLARYLATGRRNIPWRGVELVGLHASGREIMVEISFGEHVEGEERVFAGMVRDVTARRQDEQRRHTEHAVARILTESPRPGAALSDVLEAICGTLDWEIGGLWKLDDAEESLELAATCGKGFEEWVSGARGARFRPGEGLPGRIWSSGRPHWIVDVTTDDNFPRSGLAVRQGLASGFGFPVPVDDRVVAVLEFFSRAKREPDSALLETMSAIGSQIGQYLARHRAEERGRELLERERAARKEAETAARMRDQVLSVVSHDLRNYLQALTTNLAVVERRLEPAPSETVEKRTAAMHSALEAMRQLIDELLDVQRLEEGSLTVEPGRESPRELLEIAIAPYRPMLEEDRGLELRAPEDLEEVWCDRRRTIQVVANLVENAVKHTDGPIVVAARRVGDGVELSITDRGPGIPASDLPHLFDRFWQGQRGRAPAGGSGLGLAIVKGLVEAQGGTVGVESRPGEGSTFSFILPLAP